MEVKLLITEFFCYNVCLYSPLCSTGNENESTRNFNSSRDGGLLKLYSPEKFMNATSNLIKIHVRDHLILYDSFLSFNVFSVTSRKHSAICILIEFH